MNNSTPVVPKKFLSVFIMLTSCFALWGLLNNMNGIMNPGKLGFAGC